MFIKKQRMIELQNVNLCLRAGGNVKKRNWYLILGMLLLVPGQQKYSQFLHFGSSLSYKSSNAGNGNPYT